MTTPDQPDVPIIPGAAYEPPTAPIPVPPPMPPVYQQPPAQPVYYQHPPTAPVWNPGQTAGKTVVVIMTLFAIFCGIPLALCAFTSCAGAMTGGH